LSLIATAIREIIEAILKSRASNLEEGIRKMLQDPTPATNGIVASLYNHSLISGLYRGPYVPMGKKMPSYIPASNFALALLDVIMPAQTGNLSGAGGAGTPSPSGVTTIPNDQTQITSLAPLRNAILNNIPQGILQNTLLSLVDAAKDDINQARTNLEDWYNSTMDRVSGWYKRSTQWWLLGIGLFISLVMNVDSFAVYKSLMKDPVLRNSVAASAQEYIASNKNDAGSKPTKEVIDENAKRIYDLRLPIGWDWKNTNDGNSVSNSALAVPESFDIGSRQSWIDWSLKIFGWIVTTLAISLGASFWFDKLNKIMVIRSTIKPAEKSADEPSKDI